LNIITNGNVEMTFDFITLFLENLTVIEILTNLNIITNAKVEMIFITFFLKN